LVERVRRVHQVKDGQIVLSLVLSSNIVSPDNLVRASQLRREPDPCSPERPQRRRLLDALDLVPPSPLV
jgi:hypothetical protein